LNNGGAWAAQLDCLPGLDHDVSAMAVLRDPKHPFETLDVQGPPERESHQSAA
jgi:hypothetical protein